MVWLHPRFSWQCFKCWDSGPQFDEILQPIFPYEGTRRTPAPLTNTLLEGIAPGTLFPTYTYALIDRVTGVVYAVTFTPFHIDSIGTIIYDLGIPFNVIVQVGDPVYGPFRGLRANNGWDVYLKNGLPFAEMQHEPCAGNIIDGVCDFGPIEFSLSCPSTQITNLVVFFSVPPPSGFAITNYRWSFGDGTIVDSGPTPSVSHTYALGGTYNVGVMGSTATGLIGGSGLCPVTVGAHTVACADLNLSDGTCWEQVLVSTPTPFSNITAGGFQFTAVNAAGDDGFLTQIDGSGTGPPFVLRCTQTISSPGPHVVTSFDWNFLSGVPGTRDIQIFVSLYSAAHPNGLEIAFKEFLNGSPTSGHFQSPVVDIDLSLPFSLEIEILDQADAAMPSLAISNFQVCTFANIVVPCPAVVINSLVANFTATAVPGATNYHWDFGDGTSADTAGPTTLHTYNARETFNVVLTVTTATGYGTSGACPITITGPSCFLLGPGELPTFDFNTGSPQSITVPPAVPECSLTEQAGGSIGAPYNLGNSFSGNGPVWILDNNTCIPIPHGGAGNAGFGMRTCFLSSAQTAGKRLTITVRISLLRDSPHYAFAAGYNFTPPATVIGLGGGGPAISLPGTITVNGVAPAVPTAVWLTRSNLNGWISPAYPTLREDGPLTYVGTYVFSPGESGCFGWGFSLYPPPVPSGQENDSFLTLGPSVKVELLSITLT